MLQPSQQGTFTHCPLGRSYDSAQLRHDTLVAKKYFNPAVQPAKSEHSEYGMDM